MFKTLNIEGASASSTSEGEGQLVLGLGGEEGVNLSFLLESEKTGGKSLQLAVAGESIVQRDDGGNRPRRNGYHYLAPLAQKPGLSQD
jgi:hypothetical protein